ncbi:MAG TPA: sensor histidine kinase [Nocardioidaceae bacterium]|nr:sensor histidine kinase [Nocardioidaceae bacterium]
MTERAARRAVAAAVVLLVAVGASLSHRDAAGIVVGVVVGVVAALFLDTTGWRLLAVSGVAASGVVLLCAGDPSNIGWFALCVLAGWCTLRAGVPAGAAFTAAAAAVVVIEWVAVDEDLGWGSWIAGTVFTVVVAAMARRQAQLIGELRAAQAGLADRARAEERNRIARELHDVIGHALTVSQLHVSSARLAVEEDPAEAIASLVEAERLGRQSLSEVRHAVGLLREDGASSSTMPLPGGEQLPTLVDGFRKAGADVSYDVAGEPARLPATVAVTAYRILQEALTNAVRHAPGAAIRVRVEVDPTRTVLTVDSEGEPRPSDRDGVGLSGMRERAEVVGGQLAAGPSGRGWQVRAVLPGASDPATSA